MQAFTKKITKYSKINLQYMQIKNDYVTINVGIFLKIIAKKTTKLLLNNPKINPLRKKIIINKKQTIQNK
jgi:hypothetical protein